MSQLRALLPLPAVLPIEGGSPDPACSSLPCAVESVVCASPDARSVAGGQLGSWSHLYESLLDSRCRTHWPRGAVVLDCRPPLLPEVVNVAVVDLAEIQSSTMASGADAVPPEREQSFGGGDSLSLICPKLGVAPRIDPGTDLED